MSKVLIAAFGALSLLGSAAQAQSISIGPGGIEYGPRDRGYERRRAYEDERTSTIVERRARDRDCRVVTIQRENEDGDLVTRRIRRCD